MEAIVIGHKNPDTDSIMGAIAGTDLYTKRGIAVSPRAQGAPAPETAFALAHFGVSAPQITTNAENLELYLVDFSDLAQAPEKMGAAVVKGIIDHHKLGDITTDAPLEAWIWPVGSTCTVIKNIYDFYNIEISRPIAGCMLSAILSDTVIFKSPTCTETDKKAARELAAIAQVKDLTAFGMELFKVKSAVQGAQPRELIFRDYKDFDMNGKKVGIGQLEVVDLNHLKEIKEDLKAELKKVKSEGRHSVFLLLTDIMKEGSELLLVSDEPEVVRKAFNADPEAEVIWLPGVISRKKQVVPKFQKAFRNEAS